MSNETYYIFDGYYHATLLDLTTAFRNAKIAGVTKTDEFSGPRGGFALQKGSYLFESGTNGLIISKIDDDKGTVEYYEFSETDFIEKYGPNSYR